MHSIRIIVFSLKFNVMQADPIVSLLGVELKSCNLLRPSSKPDCGSGACDVVELHNIECSKSIKDGQCSQIQIPNYIILLVT